MARRQPRVSLSRLLSDEGAQAMLEAALVIPMLLMLAFGVVMAGRVTHAKVAVLAAAREASRTLAASASESEGIEKAIQAAYSVAAGYGLSQERVAVSVDAHGFERGGRASAEVTYPVPLGDLPLLGQIEVTVTGSQRHRIDPYRSRSDAR